MKIYLAGNISGNKIDECMGWRKKVREHYENWKGREKYPIIWLDPLNGGEIGTIDKEGLTSNLPPEAIVAKDYLSVRKADLIIANLDTFGEERPPIGTICECVWASEMRKPLILVTDNEWYKFHPFMKKFASWVVPSVEDLLDGKIINQFYKAMHNAIY